MPIGVVTVVLPFKAVDSEIFAAMLLLILYFAFLVYEITEDWKLKDGAFIDIQGWMIGLFIGAAMLFGL